MALDQLCVLRGIPGVGHAISSARQLRSAASGWPGTVAPYPMEVWVKLVRLSPPRKWCFCRKKWWFPKIKGTPKTS